MVDGRAVLATVAIDVPDTVQGTILARVDRLDQQARSVLQYAAVLGRHFSHELLKAVAGDGDLAPALDALGGRSSSSPRAPTTGRSSTH